MWISTVGTATTSRHLATNTYFNGAVTEGTRKSRSKLMPMQPNTRWTDYSFLTPKINWETSFFKSGELKILALPSATLLPKHTPRLPLASANYLSNWVCCRFKMDPASEPSTTPRSLPAHRQHAIPTPSATPTTGATRGNLSIRVLMILVFRGQGFPAAPTRKQQPGKSVKRTKQLGQPSATEVGPVT